VLGSVFVSHPVNPVTPGYFGHLRCDLGAIPVGYGTSNTEQELRVEIARRKDREPSRWRNEQAEITWRGRAQQRQRRARQKGQRRIGWRERTQFDTQSGETTDTSRRKRIKPQATHERRRLGCERPIERARRTVAPRFGGARSPSALWLLRSRPEVAIHL